MYNMSCVFAKHVRQRYAIIRGTSLIFVTSREPGIHLSRIQAMFNVLHVRNAFRLQKIIIVDRNIQIIKSKLKKLKYGVDM